METKILINALRECKKPYTVMLDVSAEMIADRLEELEKQNEAMLKELCGKEDLVREAEGRFYELEKELDTFKNATKKQHEPEWISVEDRLPENTDAVLVLIQDDMPYVGILHYVDGLWRENEYDNMGEVFATHWMPLPEPPKPKVPTFKDVFLKAFPGARTGSSGTPIVAACIVFPFLRTSPCCENKFNCSECWNQPYFEEEKE